MNTEETIVDAKGRQIVVSEVVGSRAAKIARLAGDAFGENMWTTATMARASVVSVAGVPVSQAIRSVNDLDGLWDIVDSEAANAALEWLLAKQEAMVADAKKSLAPQESETVSGS